MMQGNLSQFNHGLQYSWCRWWLSAKVLVAHEILPEIPEH
jgi:hypothetical protein